MNFENVNTELLKYLGLVDASIGDAMIHQSVMDKELLLPENKEFIESQTDEYGKLLLELAKVGRVNPAFVRGYISSKTNINNDSINYILGYIAKNGINDSSQNGFNHYYSQLYTGTVAEFRREKFVTNILPEVQNLESLPDHPNFVEREKTAKHIGNAIALVEFITKNTKVDVTTQHRVDSILTNIRSVLLQPGNNLNIKDLYMIIRRETEFEYILANTKNGKYTRDSDEGQALIHFAEDLAFYMYANKDDIRINSEETRVAFDKTKDDLILTHQILADKNKEQITISNREGKTFKIIIYGTEIELEKSEGFSTEEVIRKVFASFKHSSELSMYDNTEESMRIMKLHRKYKTSLIANRKNRI